MAPCSCGTRFANVISRSCVVTMKITIEWDRDRVTEMVVNIFIHKNSMMFLSSQVSLALQLQKNAQEDLK